MIVYAKKLEIWLASLHACLMFILEYLSKTAHAWAKIELVRIVLCRIRTESILPFVPSTAAQHIHCCHSPILAYADCMNQSISSGFYYVPFCFICDSYLGRKRVSKSERFKIVPPIFREIHWLTKVRCHSFLTQLRVYLICCSNCVWLFTVWLASQFPAACSL